MHRFTLCFIRKNDQVLMLNRHHRPMMGKWNGIGGKIDPGESPMQCVIREAYEETGLRLGEAVYAGSVTWITQSGVSGMHLFSAACSSETEYDTPVNTVEGILDWKRIDWVLHPDNGGIADNIGQFLPDVLAGIRYEHRYEFDREDRAVSYAKLPMTEELIARIGDVPIVAANALAGDCNT